MLVFLSLVAVAFGCATSPLDAAGATLHKTATFKIQCSPMASWTHFTTAGPGGQTNQEATAKRNREDDIKNAISNVVTTAGLPASGITTTVDFPDLDKEIQLKENSCDDATKKMVVGSFVMFDCTAATPSTPVSFTPTGESLNKTDLIAAFKLDDENDDESTYPI